MASPRPKPTAIKKLEGNRGHRPLPKDEPQPDKTIPSCPSWLSSKAKKEWKRIVPELSRLGLLTIIDRTALACYCDAYSILVRASKEIKDDFTYEYINKEFQTKRHTKPEVAIANDARAQIKAFCIEFGLTPSARSRMIAPGQKEVNDPLEEMLKDVKGL